ncbi:MAG: enoyl-CoA hydratase [Lysobacterales bacterium 69-70]|nr:enoyl-CoA hydratase/isomerase family protein [Xanthomonadaceae bacterium]ODU36061.1 MAG: enoyl-CoA hydratase [Xanthomonadaceae bacterium SCN 69-320]ODV18196.1 MAG: enoyl-CoA hydratase [Xanthomonadaceae bacterium SCN 69-25]OJY99479.1 MAG: enoyl-CoA hydratase [Xanthomonadales bacterium 69-70]
MLDLIRHDDIIELQLARPPVNALDAGLIRALREAIEAAPRDGARGLILSGRSGMFSGGLDVPSLLQLDRAGMAQVWRDLFGTCAALARSPIPTVAAITGHSPAGGAVLSIFCDYRIMARGAYRIGLNEVQVGLTVPEPIQRGLRRLVGNYRAERLMVAGAMLDSEQALAVGFVDELVDVDHVTARAQLWLRELLALPPLAMSQTRRIARADLADSFDEATIFNVDAYVDGWFGDESQHVLQALVAKLKSKG